MSKQLEEILFSAASSHYKSAEDECDFELFEEVIVMAEKYWDRMNTKPKTTKKPTKSRPYQIIQPRLCPNLKPRLLPNLHPNPQINLYPSPQLNLHPFPTKLIDPEHQSPLQRLLWLLKVYQPNLHSRLQTIKVNNQNRLPRLHRDLFVDKPNPPSMPLHRLLLPLSHPWKNISRTPNPVAIPDRQHFLHLPPLIFQRNYLPSHSGTDQTIQKPFIKPSSKCITIYLYNIYIPVPVHLFSFQKTHIASAWNCIC